jgi:hypothetical protein
MTSVSYNKIADYTGVEVLASLLIAFLKILTAAEKINVHVT